MAKTYKFNLSEVAPPETVEEVLETLRDENKEAQGYEPVKDQEILDMLRKYYECFAFTKDGDPVYQWLTGTNPVPVTRSLIYTRIRHIHELIEKVSPLVYGFSGPDFADKFLWWPDEDDPMPEA